jgi:hypothetical protein
VEREKPTTQFPVSGPSVHKKLLKFMWNKWNSAVKAMVYDGNKPWNANRILTGGNGVRRVD